MFPACPAEKLLTLWLKTGRLPILTVKVKTVELVFSRSVCFQEWSVCVVSLLGGGVLVLKHDRMASFSRQDGNSIGQDGKCNRQAVEIHDGTVPKCA